VSAVARGLRAFGMFWFNFLIGDTPEVFVGVLAVIGGALLLRRHSEAGLTFVIVLVAALLLTTVYRGRRNSNR
jgi:hypothetical protein